MSKSKGDILTVPALEEKGYDPMVYRLLCLQSHYRKVLTFSWEAMDNAASAYEKLVRRIAALTGEGEVDEKAVESYKAQFQAALDNDLNTSLAVTALYDVLKADLSDATKLALIESFDEVLSLQLLDHAKALNTGNEPVDEAEAMHIADLIAQRATAKAEKNWAEADRIRDELKAQGIELIDTPEGTTWKRS